MHCKILFFIVSIVLFDTHFVRADNWALLVAGSNGWFNYRHQADVCHAYQVLHNHGIPDSNIVVMMFDDIAQSTANPNKGVIINHPHGDDVYHGVPKDYTGATVTPQNFINILLGNKTAMQGIGIVANGPDDNVFVFFTDHGATGLVAFPSDVLYATDLNATITKMYAEKRYKQMVIYIEACESGSMLENLLPNDINIYATTASNAEESSYACYMDSKLATYLGDCYSVAWMENSDKEEMLRETLYEQYEITKRKTHESHVMEYGDLQLGKTHHVKEFQGAEQILSKKMLHHTMIRHDAVRTVDVRLSILLHRLANSVNNSAEQTEIQEELTQTITDRTTIQDHFQRIVALSLISENDRLLRAVTQSRLKLTQYNCYKSVTQYIHERCFDLQNEFVLNQLWMMANLCEIPLHDRAIKHAIDQACPQRLHFSY